ncbi:MAG TPA: cytochrome c-type biogenesis CcmF C-terminal domain-containing protein [Candidatus Sulfopaludibacter sp.]|jgi:cytochrome c-type biogenesis protein CcmF|nr:cytochrome c-type biogenesis CcmF C-terminal domain-containing protein [Candidatus Sulfopaludibacter sp.]
MENTGYLCLLLALLLCLYAAIASLVRGNRLLRLSAERSVYAVWFCLTVAAAILVHAFLTDDYRFAYVASNSNHAMTASYKFAAWWGGQEGSLLLWSWLLSCYAAVSVWRGRSGRGPAPLILVLSATQAFFLVLNTFIANPFRVLAVLGGPTTVPDGAGLNPLLQYPLMRIHPPILYLGYVGMVVPFAFSMAALWERRSGTAWLETARRWTLITWFFQGFGILLGARWAYAALGWGGYWSWDAVENASFLPWLSSTAYLHSVMMQEKRGMLRVWNVVLVSSSFFLCIFGTMMTRSGLVDSVHAFAKSSIGNWFTGFLSIGIAATVWLILSRLPYLRGEARMENIVSRESSFLLNNLLLLTSCIAILWGTLFPVISQFVSGDKVTLEKPWFNRIMTPLGLALLLLMGVAPLLPWRRASLETLRRTFRIPGLGGLAVAAFLWSQGVTFGYPLVSFALCTFVSLTIAVEFFQGSRAIAINEAVAFPRALARLTLRNTRRYGGYVVHLAIVLIFVGLTGAAFNREVKAEIRVGERLTVGGYTLNVRRVDTGEDANLMWQSALVDVFQEGRAVATMTPRRELYKASRQSVGRVDIRHRLNEDLYVNFAGLNSSDTPVMEAYLFPLVNWLWIGALVLLVGTSITLIPQRSR